jgi:hypothetical protein
MQFALDKKHWIRRRVSSRVVWIFSVWTFLHPFMYHPIDPDRAKHLTTHMIPILVSAGLPPSSHPLLALLKFHQSLLLSAFSEHLSQDLLDESIRTAAKHAAGLSAVLDQGHPVRGVALAELGKLLAVDEPSPSSPPQATSFPPSGPTRLKIAYETLLNARDELLVGFGRENEGGEVGREVRESVAALEKELGVWTSGVRNALEHGQVRASE